MTATTIRSVLTNAPSLARFSYDPRTDQWTDTVDNNTHVKGGFVRALVVEVLMATKVHFDVNNVSFAMSLVKAGVAKVGV